MKITSEQLRQMIREEMSKFRNENAQIKETDMGERMKKYHKRLDKLKDKMADTDSPTLKAKYQSTMKNILQRMSDMKKAAGIKSPFK
jgi:gentisate 1,2-dioxygenase